LLGFYTSLWRFFDGNCRFRFRVGFHDVGLRLRLPVRLRLPFFTVARRRLSVEAQLFADEVGYIFIDRA
jgi:hypothetical protein